MVLFFSSSFFHTGGVIFFFLFFHTGGVILLSMPGIFMWSKDGLPPFAVREMTGVRFQNPFLKKLFDAIQSKGEWVWGEPLDPKLYFFSKDFRHAAMMIKDDKYWNTCRLIFQCFNVGFVLTCISQASCLLEQSGRQSRENFDD